MTFENGHLVIPAEGLPELFRIGPLAVRWYALAYIVGILGGWLWLKRMIRRPCSPVTTEQLEDFLIWATLGVILGGRIGYILFYNLGEYLQHPLDMLKIWHGGMSFHGGAAGVLIAILLFSWKRGISWLRLADYIAVVQPIGQFLGRIANFANGELWGSPTKLPWGVIFRGADPIDTPRHPSQIYEALLEGALLFAVLNLLFWKTNARRRPGLLTGVYLVGFAIARLLVEMIRLPDEQLAGKTGPLHMGQWLSLPMLVIGIYLIIRGLRREPIEEAAPAEAPRQAGAAADAEAHSRSR